MKLINKILVAPQSFKGSISAMDVCLAMADGVRNVFQDCEIIMCPVADGGDGTLETLVEISNGQINSCNVTGPIGDQISSQWGAMGDGHTAVIEMARTSGLALISLDQRNPLTATTYGLGEIILDALDNGFRKFIIGIGGSATNDAGAGMAQALGVGLFDANGKSLGFGGHALKDLDSIDFSSIDPRLNESTFLIACDVNNPLIGSEGASAIYGPQKGADPEKIQILDQALKNFGEIVEKQLEVQVLSVPGSGAAGGLGAGFLAFLNSQLKPGVDIVLDQVKIEEKLEGVDLVLTGEGSIDFQTIYNKAPIGVAKLAQKYNIPTVGIAGMLGKDYTLVHSEGLKAVRSITTGPMTLEDASKSAYQLISEAVEQSLRFIQVGMNLN